VAFKFCSPCKIALALPGATVPQRLWWGVASRKLVTCSSIGTFSFGRICSSLPCTENMYRPFHNFGWVLGLMGVGGCDACNDHLI